MKRITQPTPKKQFKKTIVMIAFSPNGIITSDPCPVCQADYKIEHGQQVMSRDQGDTWEDTGRDQHYTHCPECGDSMPIVGIECEHCRVVQREVAE